MTMVRQLAVHDYAQRPTVLISRTSVYSRLDRFSGPFTLSLTPGQTVGSLDGVHD